MNLNNLFNPNAVAVIGANSDPKKLGYILLDNLLKGRKNTKLKIYPVNPTFKKVLGLSCFSSIKDISGSVDVVIIAVKPEIVSIVLKECGEKKVKNAIIITAGFKEIGKQGVKRELQIKEIAKKYSIKIVGPNCLGIMDSNSGLNASFGGNLPKIDSASFVSQSGAVGTAILDLAEANNLGFSKFVSIGNEAGLTENDFIEYLGNDKNTSSIFLYLEGVTDGKRFIDLAKKISKKKPIVVLKAGKTEHSIKAVSSHTGSLAPSHEIFKAACKKGGVIMVDSLLEMFDAARIFQTGLTHIPKKWAILTNGGGPSIVTADLLEQAQNISLAKISNTTKNKLKKVLPSTAALNNPVDIIGDALSDRYEASLKILSQDKNIDGIIVLLTPQKMTEVKKTAEVLVKYKNKKPIIPLFIGGNAITPAKEVFAKKGLANFIDPKQMVDVLSSISKNSNEKKVKVKSLDKLSDKSVESLRQLSFVETSKLMNSVELTISGAFISEISGLKKYHKKITYPWAMKVVSEQIVHKTDAGGVLIGIKNKLEAKNAWKKMVKSIKKYDSSAILDGFVVQPMIGGQEVIIGMKRDETFGPVIIFGLGGIFVEILNDVSMRIAPINYNDAISMIKEIKSIALLEGARGADSVDIDGLAKIIVGISRLAQKNKEIQEIDLNPVMVDKNDAVIVDARVMIS